MNAESLITFLENEILLNVKGSLPNPIIKVLLAYIFRVKSQAITQQPFKGVVISANENIVRISKMCAITHEPFTVDYDLIKFMMFVSGVRLVTNLFPDKSPSERELLISLITGPEWDALFDGLE